MTWQWQVLHRKNKQWHAYHYFVSNLMTVYVLTTSKNNSKFMEHSNILDYAMTWTDMDIQCSNTVEVYTCLSKDISSTYPYRVLKESLTSVKGNARHKQDGSINFHRVSLSKLCSNFFVSLLTQYKICLFIHKWKLSGPLRWIERVNFVFL